VKEALPADVHSHTAIAACDKSSTTVNEKLSASSPRRGSGSRERTCESPARMTQSVTAQQDDCCLAVSTSSPLETLADCETTVNSPVGDVGRGSPRRRSARSLKARQSEERTVDSKMSAASPTCDGATHVTPTRQSSRSRSTKSPQNQCSQGAANAKHSRSVNSSTQRTVSSDSVAGSNQVSPGYSMMSSCADGNQLHISENVSPRKILSPKNDTVGNRQVTKSVDAAKDPQLMSSANAPLNSSFKQLPATPDKVALLFGTTKSDKKRTRVRNRRNSSYCGKTEEKRYRSRVRSLEPRVHQNSARAVRPRRQTDTISISAKILNDSLQSVPALEDSGRQLRKRRKQGSDDQCLQVPGDQEFKGLQVPGDQELKSIMLKDDPDMSQCGEEVAVKRELADGDISSVTGLSDSDAMTASSDDVRTLLLSQLPYICPSFDIIHTYIRT